MEQRGARWNGGRPGGTEGDLTERRGISWNGEGPDGMEDDQMKRKGVIWNGGDQLKETVHVRKIRIFYFVLNIILA